MFAKAQSPRRGHCAEAPSVQVWVEYGRRDDLADAFTHLAIVEQAIEIELQRLVIESGPIQVPPDQFGLLFFFQQCHRRRHSFLLGPTNVATGEFPTDGRKYERPILFPAPP